MKRLAIVAVLALLMATSVQANLLVNGDFETPTGNGTLTVGGWTELGGAQGIQAGVWAAEPPSAQGAWLKGWNNNVDSGFYQDVEITPGEVYILDSGFKIQANFMISGNIDMELIWLDVADGEIARDVLDVDSVVAHDGSWVHQSLVSTAPVDAAKARCQIHWTTVDQTGGDPRSAMVDNISLEVVPEPATLSLLAFGGLAVLRRKK